MSRKAPLRTFQNYASHIPQKMNCIASPIPLTASPRCQSFTPLHFADGLISLHGSQVQF
jgi:hypothetical protein